MKGRILTKETISGFINHLHLEEKSANTIEVTSKNISPKAKKYGIIEPTNKVGDLDAVESICRR